MIVTEDDFEHYQRRVHKWLDYFGIKRYDVVFKHCKLNKAYAECHVNEIGKIAVFMLNTEMDADPQPIGDWIDASAFHEVTHLLLNRLTAVGSARYIGADELEEAEHDVIRTLENTLYLELK